MPRFEMTPWRNEEELLRVRKQLYPEKYGSDGDQRRQACNRIVMWKLRGKLPHVVESTGALTDAILHDDPQKNSPTSIKGAYSTAFCRFVTGIVDMDQTAKYKKSMFAIAKEVGIPTAFIDIRHDATHGEMPSLVVFRDVTRKSLLWLYDEYWSKLTEDDQGPDDEGLDVEELKAFFRTTSRVYLKARLAASKKAGENTGRTAVPDDAIEAYRSIVRRCRDDREKLKALSSVLLERKILVPSEKNMGIGLRNVFDLWDDFLIRLTFHQSRFLSIFVDEMCFTLVRPTQVDPKVDDYRESIQMWLLHILTGPSWESPREAGCVAVESVLQVCTMNPNHWTSQLVMALVEDPKYVRYKERYLDQMKR